MPFVLAFVAAVGTVGAGMAAVAAGSEIVGGLMIAGGVASGLGAITGNKTLSTIGAVASLGGGLAGLASGAWDSVASSLAQDSVLTVQGDSINALEGHVAADAAAGSTQGLASSGSGALTAADTGLVSPNMANVAQEAAQAPQGSMRDALGAGAPDVAQPSPLDAPGATSGTPVGAQAPAASGTAPTGAATTPTSTSNFQTNVAQEAAQSPQGSMRDDMGTGTAARYTDQPTQASGSASLWDTLQKLPNWIEKNKETAKLMGGLVGGAMNSYGQQSLLKQKYALEDAYLQKQRQRYSNSIVGLHMPVYAPPPGPTAGS